MGDLYINKKKQSHSMQMSQAQENMNNQFMIDQMGEMLRSQRMVTSDNSNSWTNILENINSLRDILKGNTSHTADELDVSLDFMTKNCQEYLDSHKGFRWSIEGRKRQNYVKTLIKKIEAFKASEQYSQLKQDKEHINLNIEGLYAKKGEIQDDTTKVISKAKKANKLAKEAKNAQPIFEDAVRIDDLYDDYKETFESDLIDVMKNAPEKIADPFVRLREKTGLSQLGNPTDYAPIANALGKLLLDNLKRFDGDSAEKKLTDLRSALETFGNKNFVYAAISKTVWNSFQNEMKEKYPGGTFIQRSDFTNDLIIEEKNFDKTLSYVLKTEKQAGKTKAASKTKAAAVKTVEYEDYKQTFETELVNTMKNAPEKISYPFISLRDKTGLSQLGDPTDYTSIAKALVALLSDNLKRFDGDSAEKKLTDLRNALETFGNKNLTYADISTTVWKNFQNVMKEKYQGGTFIKRSDFTSDLNIND